MKALRIVSRLSCLGALALLTSCIASNSTSSNSTPPLVVVANNGSLQIAVVGTSFGAPLVAVVARGGSPVSGVTITFAAPSSGASGTFANGRTTESDTSDSNGHVTSSKFTANTTAGTFQVTATASGAALSATFGLTNLSTAQLNMVVKNGSQQNTNLGTAFATALSVGVGNSNTPVSGVTVTFIAPNSGPSGTFKNGKTTEFDVTDANGIATSSTFTANSSVGQYTVSATISGGPTVSIYLANMAPSGVPAAIVAKGGTPQTATVGLPFGAQLLAWVADGNNQPVSGASVTFAAPSTGASGTFAGGGITETDTTGSNGLATSSVFTANSNPDSYTVTATVAGVASAATFSLTNTLPSPAGVIATGGTPQRTAAGTAFTTALVATVVDASGNPLSGISVDFAAPTSGAGGTFSNGTSTEAFTTDANGHATATFTANSTAGGTYNVTATTGSLTPANFLLMNTTAPVTGYTFCLSGQTNLDSTSGLNFYSVAGTILVDQSGKVTGGEEDYNDGNTFIYPAVSITGGTLTVNSTTGQGTLTLNTSKSGISIQTFAVQFVNTNHALIMEAEPSGHSTSSGSMDVQTLGNAPSGGYAFTLSGVIPPFSPIAFGGVLAPAGTLLNRTWTGHIDVNNGGNTFSKSITGANVTALDAFGRGQIMGVGFGNTPLKLNYYQVGPEALRVVDMDTTVTAVGSAFGQGSNNGNASNSGIGTSVLVMAGNAFTSDFGMLGQFTTNPTAGSLSGVADNREFGNGVTLSATSISGSYTVSPDGSGSVTLTPKLGHLSSLTLYLTDPNLNLNDPNNASGGGGALLLDMDRELAGGTGWLTPQTDTKTTSFVNNYAVAWQGFNSHNGCQECEYDMLAQGPMSAGLSLIGSVSDPFNLFTSSPTTSGDTFTGAPLSDSGNPGRYTMLTTNQTPNPLAMKLNTTPPFSHDFDLVIYQANGTQLYWLDEDADGVFLGPLEQQGSLNGIPASRKGAGR